MNGNFNFRIAYCLPNSIGIITGIDKPGANIPQVELWLKNCGVKDEKLFYVSSYTREGLDDIIDYLNKD